MPDPFHRPLFEITVKFLDPCVVPLLSCDLGLISWSSSTQDEGK